MEMTQQDMELEVLDEGCADHEEVNGCCATGSSNRT